MNKFVIKEVKDKDVILSDSKIEFALPTKIFQNNLDIKVGKTVVLTLSSLKDDQTKKEKTAKEILNEILKVD